MKVIDAAAAAKLIEDNMVVYIGGFGAYSGVDELMHGLADRKRAEGHPENLTVLSGICSGFGNMEDIGHNIICEPGLVGTIIAGHYMISGKMSRMVSENKVVAYAPPLGALPGMLRAGASGQPGVLMKVGLGTYVDPAVSGFAVNEKASAQVSEFETARAQAGQKNQTGSEGLKVQADKKTTEAPKDQADQAGPKVQADSKAPIGPQLIRRMELDGEDYLFYKALRPDACLIRGTIADENGNISLRREGLHEYQLEVAMATKNSGGTVIVQVEELAECGQIPPKEIRIPGMMVDYVVIGSPENSRQMYGNEDYKPEISAEAKIDAGDMPPMPLDVRKVIARRAAMELPSKGPVSGVEADTEAVGNVDTYADAGTNSGADLDANTGTGGEKCVVNLGIGLPAGVGIVAAEDGLASELTLSLETGPIGGIPLDGAAFAGAVNHEALMNAPDVFSFYDGGGLDMAFLGAAEVDGAGNVNVSMFGTRCAGPGGFIDISQNTPKVCFMGTFMAGAQDIRVEGGRLTIVSDGSKAKFTKHVQQITFSGEYAGRTGQEVLYVTERAVFRLLSGNAAGTGGHESQTGTQQTAGCQLELIEIAPGVDLEKDILAKMEFEPVVSADLKIMDRKIFE